MIICVLLIFLMHYKGIYDLYFVFADKSLELIS